MIKLNDGFQQLPKTYLFSMAARKIAAFRQSNPGIDVIRMDIGDVTLPLFQNVGQAIIEGTKAMETDQGFRGYGPEQGYELLRSAIAREDYRERGINISDDEIFVSDGAKSDLANLGNLFSRHCRVAVPDPSYPVYVDDNAIQERAGDYKDGRWSRLIYLNGDPANDFIPSLPDEEHTPDLILMCFPNNPTGMSISKEELSKWVEYARRKNALIIYDSAYEAYVRTPGRVRSIYEVDGAREVAIEVRSFSKTAGFTGVRCGYTVVPKDLKGRYSDGEEASLHDLWTRRQCTMFNGASYFSQRAALALYTKEGGEAIAAATNHYLGNARIIKESLEKAGLQAWGGVDSPYVWTRFPGEDDSWEIFRRCLEDCHVSTTPGVGFGNNGRGFLRFTGFNTRENTEMAMHNIIAYYTQQHS